MGRPGDNRAAEHAHHEPSHAAAAPTGGDAQENHRKVEGPGEQEENDFRISYPIGAALIKGPDNASYGRERNEDEARVHRLSNDAIEGCERWQSICRRSYRFSFELAFLEQIVEGGNRGKDERGIADQDC